MYIRYTVSLVISEVCVVELSVQTVLALITQLIAEIDSIFAA